MNTKKLLLFSSMALLLAFAGCSKTDSHESHGSAAEAGKTKYFCPMHPTYVSDRPGDCPICNMKLVPVEGAEAAIAKGAIPGRVPIALSSEKRQLIGVSTSTVTRRPLSKTLRLVGTVTHEENRFARIAPRFGGWVQSLQVNFTGQMVSEGEPLLTVYSPELFTAENDYVSALRNVRALTNSPGQQLDSSRSLLESARRRLELFQISDAEIQTLEKGGKPGDELQIRAPFTGHVIGKNVYDGQAFTAGETLYEIADLSRLWVVASVPEYEFSQVKVGQKARVIFPNLNRRSIETTVSFIYPHIDPQTRRAEVRLELDNPRHELRPNMWTEVEVDVDFGEVLTIPASAIIDTGVRNVAFVESDNDHLEPHEVKIGVRTDDYLEVLDGLSEGEKVVTRALFLVDSESQLKSAVLGMSSGEEHKH